MGFPPALWFESEAEGGSSTEAESVASALGDETVRLVVRETLRMGAWERELLLGIARQIPGLGDSGVRSW